MPPDALAGGIRRESLFVKSRGGLILQSVLILAGFSAFWFGLAGRITWWRGWLCLTAFTLFVGVFAWRLSTTNPELMDERNRPGGEVPAWDRWIMRAYTFVLAAQLAISALDSGRFQWSSVPLPIQVLGWALLIGSGTVVWQVTASNPYLSSSARVQTDRDQIVIRDGWYSIVRHPMYLAIIVAFIGMALILASWWALIPGAVNVGLFLYRTYREDEMLKKELPGYVDYAKDVKSKLVPGVW
jgi:protein-S-isoprenylcysteine O-methyltransferase Ste14